MGIELPSFGEARIDSADLTDVQPAEYRADLVIQLVRDKPVYGIVVEVQLSVDDEQALRVAGLRSKSACAIALPGNAAGRRR